MKHEDEQKPKNHRLMRDAFLHLYNANAQRHPGYVQKIDGKDMLSPEAGKLVVQQLLERLNVETENQLMNSGITRESVERVIRQMLTDILSTKDSIGWGDLEFLAVERALNIDLSALAQKGDAP